MKAPIAGTLLAKVLKWVSDGDSEFDTGEGDWRITSDIEDANVVTSKVVGTDSPLDLLFGGPHHKVVLDIDHPAKLIESSTPGHFHLYIDVDVPQAEYYKMLNAMANAGVLQRGYVSASMKRGFTAVRLPWIKKQVGEDGYGA